MTAPSDNTGKYCDVTLPFPHAVCVVSNFAACGAELVCSVGSSGCRSLTFGEDCVLRNLAAIGLALGGIVSLALYGMFRALGGTDGQTSTAPKLDKNP